MGMRDEYFTLITKKTGTLKLRHEYEMNDVLNTNTTCCMTCTRHPNRCSGLRKPEAT